MNWKSMKSWKGLTALALMLVALSGCSKLKARDELNQGVASYRAAKYDDAIKHFMVAIEADPELLNARLYLATAYANQYVPGLDVEKNVQVAETAIAEFQKVLDADPNNSGSVGGIASLYFQMKRLDEAKEYYKRWISLEPENAEAHYSVGVINWTQTYQPRMVARNGMKLKPEEPIKDAKAREALAERNTPLIDEGMDMLNKAMNLRPDYDDAMAYVNLFYREKADLVATPAEREEFLKTADEWIAKSLAIKKKRQAEEAAKESSESS